ncbi:hypothetical protein ILUMI_06436 [Ignelater luminosus]|uniref:IQ domain-containing protein K n=1 Tax=Ignelater luminosus TaxID=2038154 RepID=A0A8K0D5R5_IGNLU|nr:hypothetical protein ILUMI_06436 [Ignelater luminosus]
MEIFKECVCPTEQISVDISTTQVSKETEDLEEIDKDELIEDEFVPHNKIWQEISDQFDEQRRQIEQYRLSKAAECEVPLNPAVEFLEKSVFPLLIPHILVATVNKANELECTEHQKSAFNSIDFIAEMLWNLNPKHPERKTKWTYIFDVKWANKWLKDHPRPFYPFSWIWSKDYAATKIQAAMRGHWVRCRKDVQEMRQFWKTLAKEKKTEAKN